MLGYPVYKPLNGRARKRTGSEKGFTLIELVMGIAVISIISFVLILLFKSGIVTYRYNLRQTLALGSARKALWGNAYLKGIVWSLQEAESVSELNPARLRLMAPDGINRQYYVEGNKLHHSHGERSRKQAPAVTALEFAYFSKDARGRVVESTGTASAALVSAFVHLEGSAKNKDYTFLSTVKLRNHKAGE